MLFGCLRILQDLEVAHRTATIIHKEASADDDVQPEALPCLLLDLQDAAGLESSLSQIPSLKDIQGMLERAWAQGFDPQGRQFFGRGGVWKNSRTIGEFITNQPKCTL